MKAIIVRQFGGPEALETIDTDIPSPRPGEALIQAGVIAVNRPDILMRNGSYGWMPPLPLTPGIDMAGTVVALGPGTSGVAIGDRVYLTSRDLPQRGGCYAQFRAVPARLLYRLPNEMGLETAACLAAYQLADLLLDAGQPLVGRDTSAIVTGSSGAVGTALVQLAVTRGASVTAVARGTARKDFVAGLGAAQVLEHAGFIAADTRPEGLADAGFDALGGESFAAVMRCLGHLGTGIFYGSMTALKSTDLLALLEHSYLSCPAIRVFTMHGFDAYPERRRINLEGLIRRLAETGLTPPVALRFPLEDAAAAHRAMDKGAPPGRILLIP